MEATAKQAIAPETCVSQDWIEQELATSTLPDARLEKRLQHLVEQMAAGLGRGIPLACQDWAGTKAAYRFFSNERICEEQIIAGHFEATPLRKLALYVRAYIPNYNHFVNHKYTQFHLIRRRSMAWQPWGIKALLVIATPGLTK
jgi:hypothetical protein